VRCKTARGNVNRQRVCEKNLTRADLPDQSSARCRNTEAAIQDEAGKPKNTRDTKGHEGRYYPQSVDEDGEDERIGSGKRGERGNNSIDFLGEQVEPRGPIYVTLHTKKHHSRQTHARGL
jgi:hypothetical protein